MFTLELQKLIKERGFDRPTSIQKEGIPSIIKGKNTLLIAPTGIGKTESALLPVFDEFIRNREKLKPISILYITPLKSLNRDLLKRMHWWAQKLNIEISVRHGDTSQYERSMQAANPSEMFITTPETLQAMLVGKKIRDHLKNVRWIIIDEIHELVGNKRGVQLSIALERLKEIIKEKDKIQIIGLSATIGTPEEVAKFLTGGKDCEIINTYEKGKIEIKVESPKPEKVDIENSEKLLVSPEISARLRRIVELIEKNRSVLVFTNTREFSEVLSSRLRMLKSSLPIETHHSSLSKEVRIEAEEKFKQEKLKALICTSSLELGIDIGSINLVLQYMSPRQVSKLLQRVGRAGHKFYDISKGILIATDEDDCFEASVIAKLALEGSIEKTEIYDKSLDVLGHQIVGLTLEYYKIPFEKAYEIVKRAYPFRNLTKQEFMNVAKIMEKLGYIWVGSKFDASLPLRRRKNAWVYYYENLSTIPDTKNYKIIDVVSNKPVGTLDEEFVALHGKPGTSFIVKGQAWRIIDVKENVILVETEENPTAAIPAWEGELIPIPFEVAQEVGKLRNLIANMLERDLDEEFIIKKLVNVYPIAKEVAQKMLKIIKAQLKYGVIPDDKNILIEYWDDYVIIHSLSGSLINETLGRVLASLLTKKIGSVGLETDAYRIIIKLPGYQYNEVFETLKSIEPEKIKEVLEITLPSNELFEWKFIHVAQRFGLINRTADYGKAYIKKIVDVYYNLPPFQETLNEIFEEKLDVENLQKILNEIKKGKIKINFKPGLSPLGEAGLSKKYEIIAPETPQKEVIKIFEKRLMETKFGLVCMNCGEIVFHSNLANLEKILCKKCGAMLIAYTPYVYTSDASRIIKKYISRQKLTKQEEKYLKFLQDSASLIITHGRAAILCLSGRGVGIKTAARILRKCLKYEKLLEEILEAEKQFARTKKYWNR
ncbi:MAG: DEAD/DEAH box helicase [Candidatus Aenigmatarchaeota archaeon]